MVTFLFIVSAVVFIVIGLIVFSIFTEGDDDGINIIILFILLGIAVLTFIGGQTIREETGIESKTIIEPDMRVEILNGIADTTYIYKFQ